MCEPLLMATAALTLGSTLLSSQAASKVEKRRTSAINAETARQAGFQDRSIAALLETQGEFTPEKQQIGIDQAGDERVRRLQENTVGADQTPNLALNLTGSAPRIVGETAAQQLSRGLASGKSFAKRLGQLGAFGDQQFDNNVSLGRLSETIGRLSRDSFASSQILPIELDSANRAGDKLGMFGDLLGAAGSVTNLASATGGFGGGGGRKLYAPGRP